MQAGEIFLKVARAIFLLLSRELMRIGKLLGD